jgi:sulfur carrier protein
LRVTANGTPTELLDGATLTDLLTTLGLGAHWVVAELNGDAIPRSAMATTPLANGDKIELVRAVAGG